MLDELEDAGRRPPLLALENVVGFLIAHDGSHFARAYEALRTRGYRAGAVVIDARDFVPQSRPRAFVIAVDRSLPTTGLAQDRPGHFHPGRGCDENRHEMAADPAAVNPETDLRTAIGEMRRQGCRFLPVVDADRRVVGILTDCDAAIFTRCG